MRTLTTVMCTALVIVGGACASRAASPPGSSTYSSASAAAAIATPGSPAFGNFVRSQGPQLQFCYEDTRTSSPDLAGSATVAVTLGPNGNVVDAGIIRRSWSAQGKASDVVESCVLSRVKSWRFPPNQLDAAEQVLSFAVVFTR
jgi:hypothetical protein